MSMDGMVAMMLNDFGDPKCAAQSGGHGVWWDRERKKEYFPMMKYNQLDSLRDWMKNNGFLDRPVYDGESERSGIVRCIRFIHQFYRRVYHQQCGV